VVPPSLRGKAFEIVVAKDIVEHIQEDERLLKDLADCQDQGGTLLLSTQNSRSLQHLLEGAYERYWLKHENWLGWDVTHVRFYNPGSLSRKLESAGYRVNRWAGVYIIPYDILSWISLWRLPIEVHALRWLDLTVGKIFPFNRLGWNVILRATKV
jgi:2-polyprenyl-6-hydroxyphenyl methylase/3-demethylubiquinone-9 3-methyltransferase